MHQKRRYYEKNKVIYVLVENSNRDYLLRLSPPFKEGKDRRYFLNDKNDLKNFKSISLHKAQESINKSWGEMEEEWEFNGKTYKVLDHSLPKSTYYNINKNCCNVENNNDSMYFLCYHQGKVYLLEELYGGSARVRLYKCDTIDNKIYLREFVKWTSTKNCKVIYEDLHNGTLKMI